MKAVIAGASGLVGSILLNKLLNDTHNDQVIAIGRRTLNLNDSKLTEVIFSDLENLDSFSDQLKGDLYFCCLGTTIKKAQTKENFIKVDLDAVVGFAKIAQKNQAKSFVVISSMGADSHSMIFYNKTKGEMEEAVSSLSLLSVAIFRPSLLIGKRIEKRTAEGLAIKTYNALDSILPDTISKALGTKVEVLSAMMLETAKLMKPGVEILQAQDI